MIEELVEKVTKSNSAFKNDLREARVHRDELLSAFAGDASAVTGDAKIFKEQVDQIRAGDMAVLLDNMNEHSKSFTERDTILEDYLSEETT